MAANEDQSRPVKSNARLSSLFRNWRERFNSAIDARGSRMLAGGSERDMMKASEYLEICQECALYAYTIEDALYWHNEIITELSIELNHICATRWPAAVKANMSAALKERLAHHAAAVSRLTAVLRANERLTWQP
jgi:hypothetical protein